MKYIVRLEKEQFVVSIDDHHSVMLDGQPMQLDISALSQNTYSVLLDGRSFRVVVHRNEKVHDVFVGGSRMNGTVESERETLLKRYAQTRTSESRRSEIRAPMPALVVRIEVGHGDQVSAGQGLIVLEAMKMENELRASHPGKVKEIAVREGTPVEKDQLLMLLE